MGLEVVEQGSQPSFRRLDIGVEEYDELAVNLRYGTVVAFGKAVVAVENDGLDRRELGLQDFEAVVRTAVVGDDDFAAFNSGVGDNRRQSVFGSEDSKYE